MCPAIVWDESGSRLYETGVDHGVLYPQAANGGYPAGVPWNGLTAVTESPSGAEATPLFADNIKYLNMVSAEQFSATIEAYTYPDEFAVCDGSTEPTPGVIVQQHTRKPFGLCYRTKIGNDIDGVDYGYKLHLIYGALAAPSEKPHSTINETPEAITFSWAITTTPVPVTGLKPSASLVIDSTKVDALKMTALEELLYGKEAIPAALPLPDAVIALISAV
jgi:hypothetical protein